MQPSERKAAIRTTELEMESTINTTKQNVRKAKREYYSALFAVDNAKRQFELAREAMQLTESAYANGACTFIDVTDARNDVAAATIGYVTAGIQSELSLISLLSVLGRDIMDITY
jgi:outer membrane protein TolC